MTNWDVVGCIAYEVLSGRLSKHWLERTNVGPIRGFEKYELGRLMITEGYRRWVGRLHVFAKINFGILIGLVIRGVVSVI